MVLYISVVDLPQGWEMNIAAGRPYYIEYVCVCAFLTSENVILS